MHSIVRWGHRGGAEHADRRNSVCWTTGYQDRCSYSESLNVCEKGKSWWGIQNRWPLSDQSTPGIMGHASLRISPKRCDGIGMGLRARNHSANRRAQLWQTVFNCTLNSPHDQGAEPWICYGLAVGLSGSLIGRFLVLRSLTNLLRIDACLGLRYFEDSPKENYQPILPDELRVNLNKSIFAHSNKSNH